MCSFDAGWRRPRIVEKRRGQLSGVDANQRGVSVWLSGITTLDSVFPVNVFSKRTALSENLELLKNRHAVTAPGCLAP